MAINPAQPVGSLPTTNASRQLWLQVMNGVGGFSYLNIPVDTFDESPKSTRKTWEGIGATGNVTERGITTATAQSWKVTTKAYQIPVGSGYSSVSGGSTVTTGLIQVLKYLKLMKGQQSPTNNCNVVVVDPADGTTTLYNVDICDLATIKGKNSDEVIFDWTQYANGEGTAFSGSLNNPAD